MERWSFYVWIMIMIKKAYCIALIFTLIFSSSSYALRAPLKFSEKPKVDKEADIDEFLKDMSVLEISKVLKTQDFRAEYIEALKHKVSPSGIPESLFSKILLNPSQQHSDFKELVDSTKETLLISDLIKKTGKIYDRLKKKTVTREELENKIWDYVEMFYHWIPLPLFKSFYTDATYVPGHALPHALDVLRRCFEIIDKDSNVTIRDIDLESLILAALGHDLACIIDHPNHEKNSAIWLKTILKKERRFPERDIEKIAMIAVGHQKQKGSEAVKEHREFLEARILHDADRLSAVFDPERIYKTWMAWSKHESNYIEERPLTVNKFYDLNETIENRVRVLSQSLHFRESDGVTNLFLQIFLRRDKKFYLTDGGKLIAKEADKSLSILQSFIEGKRRDLKITFDLDNSQVDDILKIIKILEARAKPPISLKQKVSWFFSKIHFTAN